MSVVIVGAGIVGLATAKALQKARPDLPITILEKESAPAQHQTGHNSGVIHSGVYYKPGSEKAINCKKGYDLMLDFLKEENLPFDLCGKLIVANSSEECVQLQALKNRGEQNGLEGLKILNTEQARDIEPHVRAQKALFVPQAGIVDYKQVGQAFANRITANGGKILYGEKLESIDGSQAVTNKSSYQFDQLINCAGLYSDRIGEFSGSKLQHKIIPFRGEYYCLRPEKMYLVKNLIYPVPDLRFPFLGVHLTRMIHGGVEAGPNAVMALSREGYSWSQINPLELAESLAWPGTLKLFIKYWGTGFQEVKRSLLKSAFAESLQQLVPEISADDLVPGGSGVRAQAVMKSGALVDDFLIERQGNTIHVFNAPSPAATSSLAIGEKISSLLLA